jgi:adenosylmethionine-8-amino-7-oxononanoate aminotransferase
MITLSEKLRAPLSYRPLNGKSPEEDEEAVLSDLDVLIARIGAERLLALVLEPVGGLATGANVLSNRFLSGVHGRVRAAGGLMIHDEVMSGGGRTGTFLTCHRKGVPAPDIAVLAKGLGAGYAPLGVMMVSAEATDRVLAGGGFTFGHTAAANPISCAVGLAVLDALEEEGLMEKAVERGQQLRAGMERLMARHPVIGDVRGRGLLMAVELVADPAAKAPFPSSFDAPAQFRRLGFLEGLTIYARRTNNGHFGEWFMLAPPLTITEAETDDLLVRLDRTLIRFEQLAMESL